MITKLLIACLLFTAPTQTVILYLNGTSSAGKSSIARSLSALTDMKILKLDDIFLGLLKKELKVTHYHDQKINDQDLETFAKHIIVMLPTADIERLDKAATYKLYNKIRKYAIAGKSAIVDTVLKDAYITYCMDMLHDLDVIFILLYCPLDKLYEHVVTRNKQADSTEHRSFDQAVRRFALIYKLKETENDCIVDFVESEKLKALFSTTLSSDNLLSVKKQTKELVDSTFKLEQQKVIGICPRMHYNLVVNTGIYTQTQCAELINSVVALHFKSGIDANI